MRQPQRQQPYHKTVMDNDGGNIDDEEEEEAACHIARHVPTVMGNNLAAYRAGCNSNDPREVSGCLGNFKVN